MTCLFFVLFSVHSSQNIIFLSRRSKRRHNLNIKQNEINYYPQHHLFGPRHGFHLGTSDFHWCFYSSLLLLSLSLTPVLLVMLLLSIQEGRLIRGATNALKENDTLLETQDDGVSFICSRMRGVKNLLSIILVFHASSHDRFLDYVSNR